MMRAATPVTKPAITGWGTNRMARAMPVQAKSSCQRPASRTHRVMASTRVAPVTPGRAVSPSRMLPWMTQIGVVG